MEDVPKLLTRRNDIVVTMWIFACLGFHYTLIAQSSQSGGLGQVDGESLGRIYCATCHDYVEPELLPKRSWKFLLTYMGLRMGIEDMSQLDSASKEEYDVIDARKQLLELAKLVPEEPMVSDSEWIAIRDYYLAKAPEHPIPQEVEVTASMSNENFTVKPHRYHVPASVTSLVHIDEQRQQLIVGDSRIQKVTVLDSDLNWVIDYSTRNSMWVKARPTSEGVFLLSIGDISGDFVGNVLGSIFYGERLGDMYLTKGTALDGLYRPADMSFADLDGDGIEEVVVCNFGIETGSVAIYKRESGRVEFKKIPVAVLYEGSGSVRTATHDFNSDGMVDVSVLVSDADEHLALYLNRGDLEFEKTILFKTHPAFGYTDLQVDDIDQDGDMDLITVNGDSVDADPYNTLKRYHGIRIYRNDGALGFEEVYFYPMYGAYQVRAQDFDNDGDIDLAAIAFNPEFNSSEREDFVLLRQTQNLDFKPEIYPDVSEGRWLTMDAGDLDGDGDADIVLGAGYVPAGLSVDNRDLLDEQMAEGPSLLFLENNTIE